MTNGPPVSAQIDCENRLRRRAQYALETLSLAAGLDLLYGDSVDAAGPRIVYTPHVERWRDTASTLVIRHQPKLWDTDDAARSAPKDGSVVELPALVSVFATPVDGVAAARVIDFDLLAHVFFFLSGQSEFGCRGSRQLFESSVFRRLNVPLDVVDRCLGMFRRGLESVGALREALPTSELGPWAGRTYAVALTHDVDYLPVRPWDNAMQAAKAAGRHLLKQRSVMEAIDAAGAYLRAVATGQDPFGDVQGIIREEQRRGVCSSFQVAVGHRHPFDVSYSLDDDRIRDYLSVIGEQGFDLCLHGSYRSTEQPGWYEEEVELLADRLGRPLGSRQHFLSFDADNLFSAQERSGIQYDMSMGFPDRCGSRVGFSHPYFPYNLSEERPYDVVQIPLVLMDVTLRSYMGLRGEAAWAEMQRQLDVVRRAGGAVSIVWHPIVFGGARDPGYDRLYWRLIEYVQETGGLATDGRTINALVRERAAHFGVFPKASARGAA